MVSRFHRGFPGFLLIVWTVSLAVLTTGNVAGAAELDWILNVKTIASDNIFRFPVGLEVPGTFYRLMGGLQIEDVQGYNTYRFMGEAGRERVETTPRQEETPVYRLEADVSWTSRGGNYLQVLGNASRGTNTLEPRDSNQQRSLEERTDAQVTTGKTYKSGGEWQGSLIGDRMERDDLIVKRIGIAANAIMRINRNTDINFEGLTRKGYGYEEVFRDDWTEGFIDMKYLRRSERNLSYGTVFHWYSADTDSLSTDLNPKLRNFHLTGFFQTMEAITTPFSFELGLDGINNISNDWDWDLYADISISIPVVHEITMMGRRMELTAQATYQPIVNRTNEIPFSIGRLGTFDATIKWRPARTFEIDTGIIYALRFFPEVELLPDRDEVHRTATAGARWLISPGFNFRVAAILDQTDSELNTRDLEERRIEMNFTGLF